MIEYNKIQLGKMAQQYGFVRDTFEKVLRLKEILKYFNTEPYLHEHLVLKGGTAINMVIFNLPRLSVDIDMDYIPNTTKDEMAEAREQITTIIKEYMNFEGYQLSTASRFSFSLDAFHYQYRNAAGNMDNIKIELNYSLRSHILAPVHTKILTDVFEDQFEIHTLAPMEIFAAKTNALMSRAAARDLYDFNNMVYYGLFDSDEEDLFRKCIIFYNTISQETVNKSFDTSAIDRLTFQKIRRDLFPALRKKENFDLEERKSSARKYISDLMQVTSTEMEYMEAFEHKEYRPELLFEDTCILENIKEHPMALWKCKS
ncbi:nucleotidyl transferase AbiEii/AbiGii toxin family protein [Novisyntrophococcus fermenticellae]|uniref:nucleotidyl transferase AbiEii/AbiGii toxin family protein n=1 Tax=Novisyntrophococcus fermenticellae TaxID=2068655 RepID=UPI001E43AF89|nr:nucleotidyl transferase AbiEii/AbiGii toxin family protein [Novisyntrophococcus fermenticellae]